MEGGIGGPQRRKRRPSAHAEAGRREPAERPAPEGREPVQPVPDGGEPVQPAALDEEPVSRRPSSLGTAKPGGASRARAARPGERPRRCWSRWRLPACSARGNAIAYAAGATISGHHPGVGVLSFSAVMALLAGGMWARRYLAVLAFEALLAIAVLLFTLFLVEASNVRGAAARDRRDRRRGLAVLEARARDGPSRRAASVVVLRRPAGLLAPGLDPLGAEAPLARARRSAASRGAGGAPSAPPRAWRAAARARTRGCAAGCARILGDGGNPRAERRQHPCLAAPRSAPGKRRRRRRPRRARP